MFGISCLLRTKFCAPYAGACPQDKCSLDTYVAAWLPIGPMYDVRRFVNSEIAEVG